MTQTDSIARLLAARWTDDLTRQDLILKGMQILVILALAWLSFWALRVLLRRLETAVAASGGSLSVNEQRVVTLLRLGRSVGTVVIMGITLFMVLQTFGIPITGLLASAGVVGLAVSFGAQSLVRDLISGLFILIENQFGVGDVIRVGDISGSVERMTLRIVVLRDVEGTMHIIPNGVITTVSNLTRAYARAVVDIRVGYGDDTDRVIDVMRSLADEFWRDPEWRPLLTEEPTVPGIEAFGDSTLTIRMLATTLPLKQWDVARELRRRLKRRLDEEGIEIPSPHRTVYLPADPTRTAPAPRGDDGVLPA